MVTDAINGIPRRDLIHRPVWKRNLAWLAGGQLGATKTGLKVWRKVAAPIEAQVINATRGARETQLLAAYGRADHRRRAQRQTL